MGGGRNGDISKFIFLKSNQDRYRIHNDNLELVTAIESVPTASASSQPLLSGSSNDHNP
ncbi:hypothetical protein AZE42_13584 [Rhizopogon vesiculosus]|uniref:Uncharacterized protein n=1 Tax=Rhizopogon vesiculosus TaxID=180088 RepID=A0A1J8R960_9AGAM|nr:hypothetical protein AZE42_13584 [Rhizopogon vesiculosus]